MSSTIRLLSNETINLIAAGEVVEHPASVVKELVENALDAGASRITVETRGGGHQLIRVVDDGSGMSEKDALLCLERHATSKLRAADDLLALHTMGFRGEALASIAAVSRLSLHTALEGQMGTSVEVEGGSLLRAAPCARARGTTVEVRALFFNVPARKKFQKSASVSSAEISRTVSTLALAHPHVHMTLVQQERLALDAPAASGLEERVGQVLGGAFVQGGVSVTEEGLKGLLGAPSAARANRTGQYLFINKRPIVCPPLSFAVKDGYGTRLQEGRHPTFVLHVEIPPGAVDVNVHPQKREVRLSDERHLKDAVQRTVSAALRTAEAVSSSTAPVVSPSFAWEPEQALFPTSLREEPLHPPPPQPRERAIGVFSSYLFLERDGKLVVVDLQAARAHCLLTSWERSDRKEQQGLLFPISVELPAPDAALVQAHAEEIERMGFALRAAGPRSFLVEALPVAVQDSDVARLLIEMAEEIRAGRTLELRAKRCALAEKKKWSLEEALGLYAAVSKHPSSSTIKELSRHELARLLF
jgi:DNA mismatch repair protein MutL